MRRRPKSARRGDEGGYVTLLTALFLGFLMIPLCALSIDVSHWYVEVQHVQNAADAASLAGVTFLPDDFASAKSAALSVAARNGYPDGGGTQVAVAVGDRPTQLVVTVTSTVHNDFGAAIGQDVAHISRSATADYNGPVPMGSPCNAFGNEPPGSVGDSVDPVRGPGTSVISAPPGGAVCSSNPQFWAAIAGPDTPKVQGDQFAARTCAAGNDGCTGTTNDEFDPSGHFYDIRVTQAAVGQALTLQVYDPAYVETGNYCESAPPIVSGGPFLRPSMNPYAPNDGDRRYATSNSGASDPFCTGDAPSNHWNQPIVTSYVVRGPTDTPNPLDATPMAWCEHQYPAYPMSSVTALSLMQTLPTAREPGLPGPAANPLYNPGLAQVFHQWVALCTFTPTSAGDYYLQVRTDVSLAGSSDGQGGYTGNSQVWQQTGDDLSTHGDGNNRFSLRVKGGGAGAVSVSAFQTMSLFANYAGANTTFNLARVIPAAAGEALDLGFFDVGDASAPGTITVLPPTDSNLSSPLTGCVGTGVVNGAVAGCSLTNVSSATGWNGTKQHLLVPIPSSYACNAAQAGGCWFRVAVSFPTAVHDVTTWTAEIVGDPVRLVK